MSVSLRRLLVLVLSALFALSSVPAFAGGAPPATLPSQAHVHVLAPQVVDRATGQRYFAAANGRPELPIPALNGAAHAAVPAGRSVSGADTTCCQKNPQGATPAGDERYGNGSPYAYNETYGGGPLLIDSFAPMTILWMPSGYSVPSGYTALISRYLNDEHTAYYGDEWNIGNLGEYAFPSYSGAPFGRVPLISPTNGGAVLVDTDPYPVGTCTNADFSVCVSDQAIRNELHTFGPRVGLNVSTQQAFVLFPQNVGYDGLLTSSCGYHWQDSATGLYYGVVGYDTVYHDNGNGTYSTCDTPSHPNGNDADATISVLGHEQAEMMTDPQGGNGWADTQQGMEIADECAWIFPTDQTTVDQRFQVNMKSGAYVDGYFTQMMWSNSSANLYAPYGQYGRGCTNT